MAKACKKKKEVKKENVENGFKEEVLEENKEVMHDVEQEEQYAEDYERGMEKEEGEIELD